MESRSKSARSSRWSIKCGKCNQKYTWVGAKLPVPDCPVCHPTKHTQTLDAADDQRRKYDVAAAIEQCERIIEACEELPSRAEDFGIGVAEKTAEIQATIEESKRVTIGQQEALDNMEAGVNRWLHR